VLVGHQACLGHVACSATAASAAAQQQLSHTKLASTEALR
jgi:hypothetical protein